MGCGFDQNILHSGMKISNNSNSFVNGKKADMMC